MTLDDKLSTYDELIYKLKGAAELFTELKKSDAAGQIAVWVDGLESEQNALWDRKAVAEIAMEREQNEYYYATR